MYVVSLSSECVCGVNKTTLIKCMQYDETNEKYFMSGCQRVHTHIHTRPT